MTSGPSKNPEVMNRLCLSMDIYMLAAMKIIIVANGSLMSTARLCPKITGVRLRLPHRYKPPSSKPYTTLKMKEIILNPQMV